MKAAESLRSLHKKHRAANEIEDEPIPAFTDDDVKQLSEACGHELPPELQAMLRVEGVFAFAPDVFLEDVGYLVLTPAATMIDDARSLREAPAAAARRVRSKRRAGEGCDRHGFRLDWRIIDVERGRT